MKVYRMQIPAAICFSIQAENQDESRAKARQFMGEQNWIDGFDHGIGSPEDDTYNVRVYPDDGTGHGCGDIEVVDIEVVEESGDA